MILAVCIFSQPATGEVSCAYFCKVDEWRACLASPGLDAGVAHDTDDLANPPLARLLELLLLELLLLFRRQLLPPQLLLLLRLPPLPRSLGLRVALRERHPCQRCFGVEISDGPVYSSGP